MRFTAEYYQNGQRHPPKQRKFIDAKTKTELLKKARAKAPRGWHLNNVTLNRALVWVDDRWLDVSMF